MDGRNEPSPSNEKQSIRLESIVQQRLGSIDGLPNRVLLISPNRWIFHPHLETYTTWSNDVSSYGRCHLGNQRKQSLHERYFLLCWFWHQMDRLSWWKTCWWLIQMEFCKLVHLCLTSHLFRFRCTIQLCVIIGILCMLVSLVFIPHYFMIFMMMFFAGIQILCLSMIGEYASKCYMESKHRPIYIIKKQSRRGIQND